MTIRGGGHPKQAMVSTPFSRMGPPPRSFAADAHDCIMVRDPLDRPNTRVWRDDPRPMASSPLIVEARLSPSNLCSRLRTVSDSVARGGNRDGWSARPSQQGDRAASAACDTPKAGSKNASGQVRNDGRGQVESGREPSRPKPLDIKGPIQGLLRLHARYGPLDCSTAQGGLCHEAPAQSVARPNRSSATGAIDNSPGGTLLHW